MANLKTYGCVLFLIGCGAGEATQEDIETAILNNELANRLPRQTDENKENDNELNQGNVPEEKISAAPREPDLTISAEEFSLLSPDQDLGNTTAVSFLVAGLSSGETVRLYDDENCENLLETVIADGETAKINYEIGPDGQYNFRVRKVTKDGLGPCSDHSIVYTLDTIKPAPISNMTLISEASPSGVASPEIRLEGLESNAIVNVYNSDSCDGVSLASAIAEDAQIDLTLASLATHADYEFYSSQTDPAGNTSDCSLVYVDYSFIDQALPPSTGLTHWLAADDVVLDGSGNVLSLNEKSGNSFGLSQANINYQPALANSGPGGLPMIVFDGVDDHIAATDTAFNVKFILAAYRVASARMNSQHLGQIWGQYHSLGHMACDARSANEQSFSFDGSIGNGAEGKYWLDDEANFSSQFYTSSPKFLWEYDEVEVTVVELNLERAMDTITMGHLAGTFQITDHHFGGDIGEILVYDASASAATISDARDYLKNKWLP